MTYAPYNIIGTNLLAKFHEDQKINVAFRVLTRIKSAKLSQDTPTQLLTKFDIVQIQLLTKFDIVQIQLLTIHVIQPTGIIFELVQDIAGKNPLTKKNAPPLGCHTNLLSKFHEDWTINVASREKCPAPGGHAFKATKTIFELIQDIIGINLLTKFPDDRKINVASRVLTRLYYSHIRKNAPPPGGHVFQPTGIIFKLVQDIIGMNLLTKFHEDQTINVASKVKNAPPLGSHVFQANVTIFELIQDIIETNLLTQFHVDWTINVASRELTRQMLTTDKAGRTKGDHKSSI
ncbi:hypothetical protein DPMN_035205 [Dreissena polymorpha]|uniref:Uncharacterized protein n=1 Tax=Dreissena polymorpha TaxID=45954 RepID=A0A9D4M938_DREPO|nr:hypothetical protein DPMN_035205 [Dreissena polymorpha]